MSHLCLKQKKLFSKRKNKTKQKAKKKKKKNLLKGKEKKQKKKKKKKKKKNKPFLMVVGKLDFPSSKLLVAKEEGGRKYQPT